MWRPLIGRPGLRMAVWLHVKVRGREISLWPIGCTSALSVTQKRCCSCSMRLVVLYKCYMRLPFEYCMVLIRFEIEKKLREAKRKETERQKVATAPSVSQRSKDRRKVVEDKKDNKKVSALQDLKARREERKKQGENMPV